MVKTPKGHIQEFFDKPEQYQAIGKFVFQFSQLEFTIRHLLSDLLELTPTQFYIVTASYDFATLCRVTSSFIYDLPELQVEKELKDEVRDTFNACLRVNDDRVRLVHGTWEESGASHVSRASLKPAAYFQSVEEITKSIDLTKDCMNRIVKLIDGGVVAWARELRADIRSRIKTD